MISYIFARFTIVLPALAASLILMPYMASAHQPRIVDATQVIVEDPEISKAYYATLSGEPHEYVIRADEAFNLYVNVLVPRGDAFKRDVSAVILKDGVEVAVLEGTSHEWTEFYEPFGADWYLMGPEYRSRAEAGEYLVRVWSSNNDSTYSLAIGEIEAFDGKEGLNALKLIPEIKNRFFQESSISFIRSPIGISYLVFMYALAFLVTYIARVLVVRFSKSAPGTRHNLGSTDRFVRFGIALVLFGVAITTSWNPILFFFSGVALYEALARWCVLYAFIGKNTCPV